MNNIKLTRKNIGLIILVVLAAIVLPLTVLLSGQRTVLKQRATGGTGAMALKIINPTGQTNFLPRQSVTLNIVSSNPADQTVYNFAVKLDATKAIVSSNSFACAAPFKPLLSVAAGWDLVCYKESGTIVKDGTPLASFTITTNQATGQGAVDFVTIPGSVQGIKIIGEADGVVDLSKALADSTGFTFNVVTSVSPTVPAATLGPRATVTPPPPPEVEVPSFGEITEWMNNADNSCKYTVAVNWGGSKAATLLTFQTVKNGVAGTETLMCGSLTAGFVVPTGAQNSCSVWGNSFGGWAANGTKRIYRLYIDKLDFVASKETQVCGATTTVIPTATVTPPPAPLSFGNPIPTSGPEPLSWCYYTLPVSLGSDKTRVSLTYRVDAGLEEYVWCGPLAAGYYRIRSAQTPMSCANWTNSVGQTKKDTTKTYYAYLGEEKKAEAVIDTCRIGTVTVTPGTCPKKLIGDANCDNQVNLIDFTIWKNEYLKLAITKSADFNNSGAVDLIDFTLWKNGYLAGN